MEIWYTLAGTIDTKGVQEAISWINGEMYAKPVKRLRFLLASGGGELAAGSNLYTYLAAIPITVETIAFGEVDMAAIPIFLGGRQRIAIKGCQFIFHEGIFTTQRRTASLRGHEETLAGFRRELREAIYTIAIETRNDMEIVGNMLKRGKTMQAEEALEFGLCHQIVDKLPLLQQEKGIGFRRKA